MKPTLRTKDGSNMKNHDPAIHHLHWDSLDDLLVDLEPGGKLDLKVIRKDPKSYHNIVHGGTYCGSSNEGNPARETWDLKAGWNKSVTMAKGEGWVEGGERVAKMVDAIASASFAIPETGKRDGISLLMDEEGEELDVGAWLDGEERPWVLPVFEDNKPMVRIGVDMAASCGIPAEVMAARGAVVAAVATKLEDDGYGTQIYAVYGARNGGAKSDGVTFSSIRIKDSDERIDPSILAFWVAHPAAFRRIFFRIIESSRMRKAGGYGWPAGLASDDLDFISPNAHLQRAQKEGWLNNPEAAAKASIEIANEILQGLNPEIEDFAAK